MWEERHRNSVGRYNRVTEFAKFCFYNYLKDKKGKLLDLCCGKGADSVYFHFKGFNVTGIDYSPEAINQFNQVQKYKKVFITSLLRDITEGLPYDSDSYDFIYSRLGVNYFTDKTTREIFSEVKRVLKSEGYFLLQVKSADDKDFGEGEEIEPCLFEHDGYVRRYFTKEYARELLPGFKILCLEQKDIPNGSSYLNIVAFNK